MFNFFNRKPKLQLQPESITITSERMNALLREGISIELHYRVGNKCRVTIHATSQLDLLKVFYAGCEYNQSKQQVKI